MRKMKINYNYNGTGLIKEIGMETNTTAYSWGIIEKNANTLTWNNKGNITAQTKDGSDKTINCYPMSDLIKEDGIWKYNYDLNGNLIAKGNKIAGAINDGIFEGWTFNESDGEVWKYTYDLFNWLVKVECSKIDENQNQKNFHNAEETIKLIESEKNVHHLTLDKRGRLYIDGIRYRWGDTRYETKKYIISLIPEDNYINVFDRTDSSQLYYTIPENEEVESITYHPNGDWYFLTINWTTNMHTLWRIENTWDSEWRDQWK